MCRVFHLKGNHFSSPFPPTYHFLLVNGFDFGTGERSTSSVLPSAAGPMPVKAETSDRFRSALSNVSSHSPD